MTTRVRRTTVLLACLFAWTTLGVATASAAGAYDTTVLADSPTSYWRLGETTGTTLADGAGTNTGAAKGGLVLGVAGALYGDANTAVGLGANSSYVSVADAANLDYTGDFSIEAWAKPSVVNGGGGAVVHKGGSSGVAAQYRLALTTSNQWRGTIFVGNNKTFTVTAPAIATTAWTYLVMTRTGSTLRLYVNGSQAASATATGLSNTSTGILAIGRTGTKSADYFKGSIDEVALYPAALSASRVAAHFASGTPPPPPPPVAAFSADVTSGTAPLAVTFSDQSTGAPTSWSWTFGDGATSTAQSPVHSYAAAGTYSVTLTASNAGGPNSLTKSNYITVNPAPPPPPPVAAFSADVTSGTAPLAVTFSDQSTGAPTSWSWTFGDGATSTAQSPVHSYAAAGTYSVTLTASNAGGPNSLTKSNYITVTTLPAVGYQDASYHGAPYPPTSDKPQSKLWFNAGSWWADMFDRVSGTWHIFRLDRANETWIDTGVQIDDRDTTLADVLWDGTHLYVASHIVTISTEANPAPSEPNSPARLYRFSYSAGSGTYALDPGFPATITTWSSESMAIDKDSTGKLWVTWTQVSGAGSSAIASVYVNSSQGNDASWGTPFILPVAGVTASADDISTIVSYGGKWIGVLWSNQRDDTIYWAIHVDTQAQNTWFGSKARQGSGWADDHMNLKSIQSDAAGRVYAAIKTSADDGSGGPTSDLIELLVFTPSPASWDMYSFGTVADCHTRPIVVLDSQNQVVHMLATAPTAAGCPFSGYAGTIYEKTAPMSNPVFAPGRGTPVIRTGPNSMLNDATTTKQDVTGATGLVVLASDESVERYWHLDEVLGSGPPPPPVAAFSADVTSGTAPLAVTFSDQSTGAPTSWSWTFGDGATSTAQSPVHSYAAAGTYSVTLTASNAGGPNSLTKSNYITVNPAPPPPPPVAAFSADVTSGTAPLAVTFSDQSTGAPTSWSWTFGDGATSTAQSPVHSYAAAGTYSVTLTASNAGGPNSLTKSNYITVNPAPPPPPPVAAFSADVTSGTAPLAVTFSDQSTGAPTSWSWTFGDGATSTAQSPVHSYAAAGTYSVTLTASNAGGPNSLTKTNYITVNPAPPPGYRAAVLADLPVSYWRLGEATGTALADSAGSNTGTGQGGFTLGVPGALVGDPNTAIRLGTNSAYVSVANAANLNFTGDFSVEAWAKPNVVNGVGGAIVHKGGSSGYSVWQYRLSITSSNQWRGTVFVGASAFAVTAPAIATTAWTHLVMTRTGNTLQIYVNGSLAASAAVTGTTNTNTGILAIGRTGASATDYFNGSIDEVALYPTALSASRVAAHFAAGSAPPGP